MFQIIFFLNLRQTLLTFTIRASHHSMTDAHWSDRQVALNHLCSNCAFSVIPVPPSQPLFPLRGERQNIDSPEVTKDAIKVQAAEASGTTVELKVKGKKKDGNITLCCSVYFLITSMSICSHSTSGYNFHLIFPWTMSHTFTPPFPIYITVEQSTFKNCPLYFM